jgi:hypothetical protein
LTRFITRALIVVAATLGIVFVQVAPASATVHEIVGQWCSLGAPSNNVKEPLGPPGISGGSNADNFARPLAASGVEIGIVPFQDGFRVNFNFNRPNVKVVGTGQFIVIGEINGAPLYLELIQPNPAFPAFQHCPKLATG